VTLGNKYVKVRAVVVPDIKSKIKSSHFPSIIKKFKEQNIPLADTHLIDKNDDGKIDMLLGVDYAHILPVHACYFGGENRLSLLYYTSKGIMLAGNMSNLLDACIRLEIIKEYIEKIHSII
jgi:hypothetical protein